MIIRDPLKLNEPTRSLWIKQEGLIVMYRLPFALFETLRELERQRILFESGYSKTMQSNHLDDNGTGANAWDVAKWGKDGWSWKSEDIFWYQVLGILTVNLIEGVRWGADWNGKELWFDERFRDYGHYERIK